MLPGRIGVGHRFIADQSHVSCLYRSPMCCITRVILSVALEASAVPFGALWIDIQSIAIFSMIDPEGCFADVYCVALICLGQICTQHRYCHLCGLCKGSTSHYRSKRTILSFVSRRLIVMAIGCQIALFMLTALGAVICASMCQSHTKSAHA